MAEKTSQKPYEDRIPSEAREHMKAAHDEMRKGFEAMMPEGYREFREHRRAARKEMLMAWRSMIDGALKKMDERSS